MAAFLSDEWLAELAEELRAAGPLGDGPALLLGQVVTGVPVLEGADVAYTIRLGGGQPAVVLPGTVEGADVVLVEDYGAARAIASGTPPASLLAEGRVKVRGDAGALVDATDRLAALGDALARVAVTTHFEEAAPEAGAAVSQDGDPGGGEGDAVPVLERALLRITPGEEGAFLAAFPGARAVILSAEGCRSARLLQGVESPSSFLLLVEWRSLADHMTGFRDSPLFAEWRRIIGPFFAEPPAVEHYYATAG